MEQASRDENRIPTLLGVSSVDGTTPVKLFADPTTHRLYVDLAAGGTATVDAGTTTTLAPGASATVVNSGTTTDAVFDFGIPAGEKGDPGDPGPTGPVGMVWKDAYVCATAYVVNDAVSYNGSSYICILNSTGNLPTDTTYWSLVAQKGADGLGAGDMLASVYDPTNVAGDAFDMDNMAQGTTNKFLSSAELTVVQNTSGTNTGDQEATDFDIKDLTDSTNLRTTWSGKQDALGFTPEDIANKSTNVTTDGASDTKYPSAKAVKDYADGLVAGLLDYRGGYDASSGNYPTTGGSGVAGAVMKGDMWIISVAGTLGGEAVQVGDSIIANTDTPGQTASNWNHLNRNLSYVPEDIANKENTTLDTSTSKYPTNRLVKEYADSKAPLASPTFTGTVTIPKTTEIQDTTGDHQYVLAVNELTADRTITLPLLIGNDEFVFKDHTQTLTNKRITPRITTITSHATPTINTDNCDAVTITAQAEAITSMTTNLSGTPTNFQKLIIRIKDDGAARAITWGTSFQSGSATLPTTTVLGKTLMVGLIYDSVDSKWTCEATGSRA